MNTRITKLKTRTTSLTCNQNRDNATIGGSMISKWQCVLAVCFGKWYVIMLTTRAMC